MPPAAYPPPSPPTRPNPLGRRLYLLCILLVLPILAVSLPTLLVTHFFGQRPAAAPENPAAFEALRGSLEKAARESLPDGPALSLGARFDALTLPCPPETVEVRLEALRGFAALCQGVTLDQPADADGHHLLVELPEANAARFRELATGGGGGAPPAVPPAPDTPKVFLNVTLTPPPSAAPTTAAVQTPP